MSSEAPKPDWSRRWLLIKLTLAFCASVVLYCVLSGRADGAIEGALYGCLSLAGSVILGYCGFAAWDDRNFMEAPK